MENLPATYVEGFHDLEAVKKMEYKQLGKTGLMVSKLSYGGGPLGCHYGIPDENEAIEAIRFAIRQGINYIDTGPWYGQGKSETIIGKALKGIPRKAYYIATKVGRYELDFDNMFDFSAEKTRKSFKKSLERLGVNYVDVLQVHDIEFAPSLDIIITQTLPELSKLVSEGKVKNIGITGYPVSVLKECIEKSNINIACVLSYSRYTLIDDTLLKYIPFFKEFNIGLISAAAPCMGLLTDQGPPAWHPADDDVKKQCKNAVEYCQNHGSKIVKLAVWFSMQCKDIDTHLIGMMNVKEVESNLATLHDGITDKEQQLLNEIQNKYLSNIKGRHWENKELTIYWNSIKK
ncbi:L-galactose dehydrogenase-like isoform X1 [Aphidius gifuensis]|uniref:L-galactose dehydrogenase-like isoform X1 n=1 Tax=Aphidius gifuensis TaxID=684658 RepID=UPI001CDB8FEE|nr:L-galactose dehydrogenase-like isoform X1 [Aphidius gifuensis]